MVRAVRERRAKPAGFLVLAPRARLESRDLALDALLDRVVVTNVEVQKRMFFGRSPIAPVERVRPDQVERPRDDPPAIDPGQDDFDVVRHPIADVEEKVAVQIAATPTKL